MVRSITADGMLMTTRIGGPILPTLDGEYCRIHTRDGRIYTGTILSLSPAAHVFDDVLTRRGTRRTWPCASTRWWRTGPAWRPWASPPVTSCVSTQDRGHRQRLPQVPVYRRQRERSLSAHSAELMHIAGQRPRYDTEVCFTVHEEVGHGGATLPQVDELLAVDMGCVGDDLGCTERQVSICAKDNGAPTTMAWSPAWWSLPGPTPSPTRWTSTPLLL